MQVRVEKLAHINSRVACPTMDNYIPGKDNGDVSLPIEYWITGNLLIMEVGQPMVIARDSRNGIPIDGMFQSSPITKIEADMIYTQNSQYKVTTIDERKDT